MTVCLPCRTTRKPAFSRARIAARCGTPGIPGTMGRSVVPPAGSGGDFNFADRGALQFAVNGCYSSIAALMLSSASASVLPCDQHPGSVCPKLPDADTVSVLCGTTSATGRKCEQRVSESSSAHRGRPVLPSDGGLRRRAAAGAAGAATDRHDSCDPARDRTCADSGCRTGRATATCATGGACRCRAAPASRDAGPTTAAARAGARADRRRADTRCTDTHRADARGRTAITARGRGEQHRFSSPSRPGETAGPRADVVRTGSTGLESGRSAGCLQAARTAA